MDGVILKEVSHGKEDCPVDAKLALVEDAKGVGFPF
jgi:hypothetical protein